MEQSGQNVGRRSKDLIMLGKDAPVCGECHEIAEEMYEASYELWIACKSDPVCALCIDKKLAKQIVEASATRGFRVGL